MSVQVCLRLQIDHTSFALRRMAFSIRFVMKPSRQLVAHARRKSSPNSGTNGAVTVRQGIDALAWYVFRRLHLRLKTF